MLQRIYIDNYKSLVNFELSLKEINLFLGANGSGKSAVFETLRNVRDFVSNGEKCSDLFSPASLTRWQSSYSQTFEFEIEGNGGVYSYELSIEYSPEGKSAQVAYERLLFDRKPLLSLTSGEVTLYRDDFSEGPHYAIDATLSAVGAIPSRPDSTRLTLFKEYLKRFIIVQVIPPMICEESPQEEILPSVHLENYTSWYRYISQDQGMAFELMRELREVLPGFDYFKFESFGEKYRLLKVYFQDGDAGVSTGYSYGELSDGQKMLIVLYSLLYAARTESKYRYTLFIDEPENFLALPEIQPWLTQFYDGCMLQEMQGVLISHHPEFINYLLASPVGYWFERQSNRPTRVKPVSFEENESDAYPKFQNKTECKSVVAELARNRHNPLPSDAPGSLKTACTELSRIL